MKLESMLTVKAVRSGATFPGGFIALAAVAALLLASAAAQAADPKGSGSAGKSSAVTLEAIPGSTVKRVILTAKAAERLGIETGNVGEELVVRKQMVSGLVTYPVKKPPEPKPAGGIFGGFGGLAPVQVAMAPGSAAPLPRLPAVAGEAWVSVALSPAEWERLVKDKPARILPLATRDNLAQEVFAKPVGWPPIADVKRSMLTLYYVVPGKDHGLTLGQRMRVELQLSGDEGKQKVVPYGAVYYDAKGTAWVYVNTKPLVFERQRIGVERVVGDLVVLSEGPSLGTPVVTVGAALLYGAEIFGK